MTFQAWLGELVRGLLWLALDLVTIALVVIPFGWLLSRLLHLFLDSLGIYGL